MRDERLESCRGWVRGLRALGLAAAMALFGAGCPPLDSDTDGPDTGGNVVKECGECPAGTSCDATTGLCVACVSDKDCAIGVCDDGVCVGCTTDADCASGYCLEEASLCVGCYEDAHCPNGACLPDALQCVECVENADCPSGVCDPATNTCEPPNECPDEPTCPPGATAADTDGDGCPDACLCGNGVPPTATGCPDDACYGADGDPLCDDGDPCTEDLCVDGECFFEGGLCQGDCGGPAGLACEEPGAFCDPTPGSCNDPTAWGTCFPAANVDCADIYMPVCGCDGQTYGNDCVRAASLVGKAYDGPCDDPGEPICCLIANSGFASYEILSADECAEDNGMQVEWTKDTCGATPDEVCCLTLNGEASVVPADLCESLLGEVVDDEVCEAGCEPIVCFDPITGEVTEGVDTSGDGCPDTCPDDDECASNADCGDDAYCAQPGCVGLTNVPLVGLCLPKPEACPANWSPVCGCDGETYGNECEAAAAGQNVASEGVCEGVCEPIECVNAVTGLVGAAVDTDGDGCPDTCEWKCLDDSDCGPGGFCQLIDCGVAGAGFAGYCADTPTVCPENWAPVCGCDGLTYGNACEAAAAGVSLAGDGACVDTCEPVMCPTGNGMAVPGVDTTGDGCPDWCPGDDACLADEDCVAGAWCVKEGCNGQGLCVPFVGIDCPAVYEPVCGCDGATYGNACEAFGSGVNVASEGPCGDQCLEQIACVPGTVPVDEDGDGCPDQCVCADGTTPDPSTGLCAVAYCSGWTDFACPDGQFCELEAGTCGWADEGGVCLEIPFACPYLWDPVCGCDGEIYANDCERQAAGVSLAPEGACDVTGCEVEPCVDGEPFDVDGDGCHDSCLCLDTGSFVPPGELCTLECPVIECPDGLAEDQDGDGCWDTCVCEDGAEVPPSEWCEPCPIAIDCLPDMVPGDSDGDGCDDTCYCAFVLDCLPGMVPGDSDGDGCDDTCYCADGSEPDATGSCGGLGAPCGAAGNAFAPIGTCGEGTFCELPEGVCGLDPFAVGFCAAVPEVCPYLWDPVCGCDGEIYANDCERQAAGVSLADDDFCETP